MGQRLLRVLPWLLRGVIVLAGLLWIGSLLRDSLTVNPLPNPIRLTAPLEPIARSPATSRTASQSFILALVQECVYEVEREKAQQFIEAVLMRTALSGEQLEVESEQALSAARALAARVRFASAEPNEQGHWLLTVPPDRTIIFDGRTNRVLTPPYDSCGVSTP
jgi:hypothetical protein